MHLIIWKEIYTVKGWFVRKNNEMIKKMCKDKCTIIKTTPKAIKIANGYGEMWIPKSVLTLKKE
jgi:hypothetical protein